MDTEMELTEKDILLDAVAMEKALAATYGRAALESANSDLRDAFLGMAQDEQGLHARLFHEAHAKGWYKTSVAGDQAIDTALNTWQKRVDREPSLSGLRS